jgi:hypothetical protein
MSAAYPKRLEQVRDIGIYGVSLVLRQSCFDVWHSHPRLWKSQVCHWLCQCIVEVEKMPHYCSTCHFPPLSAIRWNVKNAAGTDRASGTQRPTFVGGTRRAMNR